MYIYWTININCLFKTKKIPLTSSLAEQQVEPLEFSTVHAYSPVSRMTVLYSINVELSSVVTNSKRLSSWLRWFASDQVAVGEGLPRKEQVKMAVSSANTVRDLTLSVK